MGLATLYTGKEIIMKERCENKSVVELAQELHEDHILMCDSIYRYTQLMCVVNYIAVFITFVCTFFVYLNRKLTTVECILFLVVAIVTCGNNYLWRKCGKGFNIDHGD